MFIWKEWRHTVYFQPRHPSYMAYTARSKQTKEWSWLGKPSENGCGNTDKANMYTNIQSTVGTPPCLPYS